MPGNITDLLPVYRVTIEARGQGAQVVRLRKTTDFPALTGLITRWLHKCKASGKTCEGLTLTFHQLDCDHEDPTP